MSGQPAARIDDAVSKRVVLAGASTVLIGDAGQGQADKPSACEPAVGDPVNPVLGVKLLPAEVDFALPAPLPLVWSRSYLSSDARVGALGQGWSIPGQALGLEVDDQAVTYIDAQGRRIRFSPLAPGQARYSPSEQLWIRRGGPVAPQVDAYAPWTGRWAGVPPELRHDPSAVFIEAGGQFLHFARRGQIWRLIAQFDRNGYRTEFGWDDSGTTLAHVRDSADRLYWLAWQRQRETTQSDTGLRLAGVILGEPAQLAAPDPKDRAARWLVRYVYDEAGDLVAVHDRRGRCVRRFHWCAHIMTGHGVPGGLQMRYEWDRHEPKGRVLAQHASADAAGKTGHGDGQDPSGLSRSYHYHEDHTVVRDSLGREERYHFQGEGGLRRWVAHTRADGSRVQFAYDAAGRLATRTDALGRTWRLRRDGAGRVIGEQAPDGSAWSADLDDSSGAIVQLRGPEGLNWHLERDARANVVASTGPDGARTRYRYGEPALPDRPTEITDAHGGVRRLQYNARGQLVRYTDCSGHCTTYHYDDEHGSQAPLVGVCDALGHEWRYRHDVLGRVLGVQAPRGHSTAYTYDELGRIVEVTLPGGATERYSWDARGRLVGRIDAGGLAQRYRYDSAGRLVELLNEQEVPWRYEYDEMDRVVREVGVDGRTQHYSYNAAGELVERGEQLGAQYLRTRYAYDKLGRITARELPATGSAPASTERYRWRADGQLAGADNPHAQVLLAYDEAGRLAQHAQHHLEADPAPAIKPSQIAAVQHALQQRTQAMLHELGMGMPAAGQHLAWRYALAQQHDVRGAVQSSTYGDCSALQWMHYGPGHLHGLRLGDALVIDFERDALHRESERNVRTQPGAPLGLALDRRHDALGRLAGWRLSAAGAPAAASAYRYDDRGWLAGVSHERHERDKRHQRDGHLGRHNHDERKEHHGAQDIVYHHDASARLVGSRHGKREHRYRHDPAGNRLEEVAAAAAHKDGKGAKGAKDAKAAKAQQRRSQASWYQTVRRRLADPQFNPLGEGAVPARDDTRTGPTHWRDNRITELHGWRYTYDDAGNVVQRLAPDGTRLSLGYDGAHRLVQLLRTDPDDTQTWVGYRYDALSRRIAKTVLGSDGQPRLTRYGWDGDRLVCEARQDVVTTIVYEPGGFVPLLRIEHDAPRPDEHDDDDPAARALIAMAQHAMAQAGMSLPDTLKPEVGAIRVGVFVTDHLGTPMAVYDPQGSELWRARPDDWAGCADEQGSIRQLIRYPGQWLDEESGLHYNRYRYYDPVIGRYITQDPIGVRGGTNSYSYARQKPLQLADPVGLQATCGAALQRKYQSAIANKLADLMNPVLEAVRPAFDYASSVAQRFSERPHVFARGGGLVVAGVGVSSAAGVVYDTNSGSLCSVHTVCGVVGPILGGGSFAEAGVGTGAAQPGDVSWSAGGVGGLAVVAGGIGEVSIASDGSMAGHAGKMAGGLLGGGIQVCRQEVSKTCSGSSR